MLLWADSFDHYGSTFSNMFLGEWAAHEDGSSATPSLSTAQARTGTRSIAMLGSGGSGSTIQSIRRTLKGLKTRVGIGMGVYFPSLPGANDKSWTALQDNALNPLLTLCIESDGSITTRKGGPSGTVIGISDAVITAGTFHHIEFAQTFDAVAGASEVRVNGITVLMDGGLNLGSVQAAQVKFANQQNGAGYYLDDVFAWDDSGSFNNDFLGAQRVLTEFPNADTAQADFALTGAASGFGCINQTAPDGDTTYIRSTTVGAKSDFGLPSLPPETQQIVGVYVPVMAKLDAAGIGNVQPSMKSSAALLAGNDDPLTTGYTYYGSVFEYDPNTGLAWDKAGLEAALLRIEKSL